MKLKGLLQKLYQFATAFFKGKYPIQKLVTDAIIISLIYYLSKVSIAIQPV